MQEAMDSTYLEEKPVIYFNMILDDKHMQVALIPWLTSRGGM